MPKDSGKPRGRTSAYAFFLQACREEHKKTHPNEKVVFGEFTKLCSQRWKNINEKDKYRFQQMAEKDKKRYEVEMANYVPDKSADGRKGKRAKDPNAPKRPLSAFFWFSNDERAKVKAAMPDASIGNVAKELGRRWSEFTPDQKAKYEALAAKDKARYEKEMESYNKNGKAPVVKGKIAKAAKVIKQVSSEEEDDEEEEDEEESEEDDD